MILIDKLYAKTELDNRMCENMRVLWRLYYNENEKAMKYPINITIKRTISNRPYALEKTLKELSNDELKLLKDIVQTKNGGLTALLDTSVIVGQKITADNYNRFLYFLCLKKEISDFLYSILSSDDNNSHVYQIVYTRKRDNSNLRFAKDDFTADSCCLEYVHQMMSHVGFPKENIEVAMEAFSKYINEEAKLAMSISLAKVLVKNQAIKTLFKGYNFSGIARYYVNGGSKIIRRDSIQNKYPITKVQQVFFHFGLSLMNMLVEDHQKCKDEINGREDISWNT